MAISDSTENQHGGLGEPTLSNVSGNQEKKKHKKKPMKHKLKSILGLFLYQCSLLSLLFQERSLPSLSY